MQLTENDICLDFETFWAQGYSLSGMTTREYIMDSRFEAQLLAVKTRDEEFVLEAPEIDQWINSIYWGDKRVIGHNLQFDASILAWRFGKIPRAYFCTAQAARSVTAHLVGSASLKDTAAYYGMRKDVEALTYSKNKRYYEMDRKSAEFQRWKRYGGADAVQSWTIAGRQLAVLPPEQVDVIDIVTRMYVQGRFELDVDMLEQNLRIAAHERERLMERAGVTDLSQIRSRDKFADLLRLHGVSPPTKISDSTGEETYAFSKKDLEFIALLEHDKPEVRFLVELKLNASSTIEESRTQTMLRLAKIPGAKLQAPLFVSGAHTHRFSGTDNLNMQNLPRKSLIKKAIRAPEGYKVVAVDASQIEARILAWAAGCMKLVTAFANGEDVYSSFASEVYGRPINKADNPDERFVGKVGVLSLGYGTGKDKLHLTLTLDGVGETYEFATNLVKTYRQTYPEIPLFWRQCDDALQQMVEGGGGRIGPMKIGPSKLISPYGLEIPYPDLRLTEDGYEYWRHRYKSYSKIYGAALTENIIQHLAWTVIAQTMVYTRREHPNWFCALQVHDELVYIVPEAEAEYAQRVIEWAMCRQPGWAATKSYPVPLAAEGNYGDTYYEAK